MLATLEQANLLFDAEAWDALRQVNDLLKAQIKRDAHRARLFASTLADFAKKPHKAAPVQAAAE